VAVLVLEFKTGRLIDGTTDGLSSKMVLLLVLFLEILFVLGRTERRIAVVLGVTDDFVLFVVVVVVVVVVVDDAVDDAFVDDAVDGDDDFNAGRRTVAEVGLLLLLFTVVVVDEWDLVDDVCFLMMAISSMAWSNLACIIFLDSASCLACSSLEVSDSCI